MKILERRIVKPIDFVFENLDTSDLNQKVYLPTLISETMSDFYFRKARRQPGNNKAARYPDGKIKASPILGGLS